ncbi:MAG: hypothetical protein JEY94_17780 [Melioribacteraceae bacterium]|nr:hypothetical protein [Melioribacteraceae bacterium]
MKRLYILLIIFISSLFVQCDHAVTIEDDPATRNYKLKKETWYISGTDIVMNFLEYEYYENGLLKHVKMDHGSFKEKDILYNSDGIVKQEIMYSGPNWVDTLNYICNEQNLLIREETVHTSNITYRNSIEYNYNDNDQLIETIDRRGNQNTVYRSTFEYKGGLVAKKYDYADDYHLRTYEYEYDKGLKTKETILRNGKTEYTYIYNYENGLLKSVKGYFSDMPNIDSEENYIYDENNKLIIKEVKVSMVSSYTNHEIHYEYYR